METKKDKPSVMKFTEMLEYQPGSVVSREIINSKSGTVTLFAFSKGEGLSEHTAPFDALVNVIDGKAKIIIGSDEFLLSKGDSIIMPANIPHALKAEERYKMLLVMIKE